MAGPANVFPLAEFLYDEMKERGWTTDDVASRMGGDIVRDLICINLVMAVQEDGLLLDERTLAGLSRAFDVSEAFLRNLDQSWRDWPDRRSKWECPEDAFGPLSNGWYGASQQ